METRVNTLLSRIYIRVFCSYLLIICGVPCLSYSQDAACDITFTPGTGADQIIYTTSLQADGKIIIGGDFANYNGTAINHIARLNTNGTFDASFNIGTGIAGGTGTVWATSIQANGKVIVGGDFTSYNGVVGKNNIVRINTDGSIDASFNPGTGPNSYVRTMSVQSDGKIIIGGAFTTVNTVPKNYICRLNTDGSLDNTFNIGSGTDNAVWSSAIQADGKIIIGGVFTSFNSSARNHIARLNIDGSLDFSLNVGTGADNFVQTIAIQQADQKIVIGGYFTNYNGTLRNYVARINPDGTLDAGFNPGTGANTFVRTSAIQGDGKIIIGGAFTSFNNTNRNYIARLNIDGTLDGTFAPTQGANNVVWTANIQSDWQIIIGGNFTSYNGMSRNHIARLKNSNTTNVEENNLFIPFTFYPNPTINDVTIVNAELGSELKIADAFGKIIYTDRVSNTKMQIELSNYKSGDYFIIQEKNGKTLAQKLIINKN